MGKVEKEGVSTAEGLLSYGFSVDVACKGTCKDCSAVYNTNCVGTKEVYK